LTISLKILTQETHPFEWATIQNNLGEVYNHLQVSVDFEGDRQTNPEKAIQHYQEALNVRTREQYPFERAVTLNNLGNTYSHLQGQDKLKNLQDAEECYLAALEVRTQSDVPIFWATTQNNLGNAYRNWVGGEKVQQAKKCYQKALKVRTRDKYPFEWAMTQNNLGITYNLLAGKRWQTNRDVAIKYHSLATRCHLDALEIYTQEAFPVDWARTQNNLSTIKQLFRE
jgi:tetratricopeptide (TPR) repeat protein